MKGFMISAVALGLLASSLAQDDGRYRPDLYGADDGSYRPSNEGRYSGANYGAYRADTRYDNINYRTGAGRLGFDARTYQTATVRPRVQSVIVTPEPVYTSIPRGRPGITGGTYTGRSADANAFALRDERDIDLNNYRYLYETTNGINVEESGRIENEVSGTEARGFYEFVADDGVKYRVDYTAGPQGFVPVGAHLPVPPQ